MKVSFYKLNYEIQNVIQMLNKGLLEFYVSEYSIS